MLIPFHRGFKLSSQVKIKDKFPYSLQNKANVCALGGGRGRYSFMQFKLKFYLLSQEHLTDPADLQDSWLNFKPPGRLLWTVGTSEFLLLSSDPLGRAVPAVDPQSPRVP